MTSPDKVKTWKLRSKLLASLHKFFDDRGFTHLDTPLLVGMPGYEVHLNFFQTDWFNLQHKAMPRFLRSSPEIHLKKALSSGLDKVYEVGKCFRNVGELGPLHHPEFTMVEWYQTDIDYMDFMQQTEDFLRQTREEFLRHFPSPLILPQSFRKISVFEAFEDFAKVQLVDDDPTLRYKAQALGHDYLLPGDDFETSYFKILLNTIEPRLKELGAIFLYDFPPSQAALAEVKNGKAKRFEAYINGVELCNAFSELTSSEENKRRFADFSTKRQQIGATPFSVDEGFIAALDKGLPASCGNALGFDRWFALLLGDSDLQRAISFPSVSFPNLK
ncbi:MAG: amino acid--tRNA ligase-related protein [Oligoflexales bacterium]